MKYPRHCPSVRGYVTKNTVHRRVASSRKQNERQRTRQSPVTTTARLFCDPARSSSARGNMTHAKPSVQARQRMRTGWSVAPVTGHTEGEKTTFPKTQFWNF